MKRSLQACTFVATYWAGARSRLVLYHLLEDFGQDSHKGVLQSVSLDLLQYMLRRRRSLFLLPDSPTSLPENTELDSQTARPAQALPGLPRRRLPRPKCVEAKPPHAHHPLCSIEQSSRHSPEQICPSSRQRHRILRASRRHLEACRSFRPRVDGLAPPTIGIGQSGVTPAKRPEGKAA